MGPQRDQGLEHQVLFLQRTADGPLRQVRHEDHAHAAVSCCHVPDHGGHIHLLQRRLHGLLAQTVQRFHKGLGAEGIALGRNGEPDPVGGLPAAVVAAEAAALLHDGGDLGHQLLTVLGQDDAPVGPVEDGDAQLLLHFRHGAGEGGLGHIQALGRLVHGAAAVDLQDVVHL